MIRPLRVLALVGAALFGAACTGSIDTAGPGGSGNGMMPGVTQPGNGMKPGLGGNGAPLANPNAGGLDDSAGAPGATPLRRLTVLEYKNSIRDLLGVEAAKVPVDGFPGDLDSSGSGFYTGAKLSTGDDARVFNRSAEAIADLALTKIASLVPCSPVPAAGGDQDACAAKFITQFGQRAFRRPLSMAEATKLTNLYKAQRGAEIGATFEQSIASVVGAIVQTPFFLYHWELGPNAPKKDGSLIQYNPWEMASRLSYLLWASMPDDKLFASAQAGGLTSPEQIAEAARRLLADPKAKDAITDFHYQWLEIFGLKDMPKDPGFTDYNASVAAAMTTETQEFVNSIFFGPKADGKLTTLLTSNHSFVDENLAKIYKVSVPGKGMQAVDLDATQRAGIFTEGGFLAVKADAGTSLPPRRGDALLHRVLCIELKIPDNLDVPAVADPNPMQTTRQRFEVHGKAACAQSCHSIIDPVGFAFEEFDAVGAYRTQENGMNIDSSGTFNLNSGPVTFKNAVEMINELVKRPETTECMVKQWLRYGMRRQEGAGDEASLKALQTQFKSSGDLRELIVALTKTRSFTHRTLSDGEVAQ
jgi:hypothetical protein